jgi:outer membrane protein OmpA-like peptidoglycan-associated protein
VKPLLTWLLALAGAVSLAPAAADPLQSTSVDELVKRLSVPDGSFKSFTPTRAPGADHQCAGNHRADRGASTGSGHKNFAVEYADATDAQVDLAVQFEIGSDKLLPAGRDMLRTVAQALNRPELANHRFAVAGHTDQSGPLDLNLRLSCARAIAVRDFLIQQAGVAPARVWAYGFGPRRLLALQDVNDPRHRRVEIRRAPD